jgi:hypothetical protein
MTPDQLIHQIESLGGRVVRDGERLRYELPPAAAPLLADLRVHKRAVLERLRSRPPIPTLPDGVRLVQWEPKAPPIVLTRWSVVTDAHQFISNTLRQLRAALAAKNWVAENWSVRDLVERLEDVGVYIEVDRQPEHNVPRRVR